MGADAVEAQHAGLGSCRAGPRLDRSTRDRVDILVSYLGDLTRRVQAAIDAGVGADEIVGAVSLDEYESYFPYFRYSVNENILRAYEELVAN